MAITEEGIGEGNVYDQKQEGPAAWGRELGRVAQTECGEGNSRAWSSEAVRLPFVFTAHWVQFPRIALAQK